MAQEGSAGLIGRIDGQLDFSSGAVSRSGDIRNGWVWNSSGQTFGLVKMLTLAGAVLLAMRIWRSK